MDKVEENDELEGILYAKDSSGYPAARHERGVVADSLTRREEGRAMIKKALNSEGDRAVGKFAK